MADKPISELVAAGQVKPGDLFVLEQDGTAKKLTGQILENWLVSFADGHGGIQSIVKQSTSGLTDTYRITMADTTTFDFTVSNGKGITGIAKQSTSGLVDTYKVSYNDGTSTTFTVTNGAKGDKGDDAYLWIKYASQEPTPSSHSMSDIPDDWIGVYSGNSPTAPTDWQQYKWSRTKGDKGDKGDQATLVSSKVEYQVSDSGTIIPSGVWSTSVPVVAQGKYLWTRTTTTFNTGNPVVSYSVSRMGIDGSGSVSSVAGISPNPDGNVELTAKDVGALPDTGGDVTGELRMNGQPISGLNQPTEDTQAANKEYVDASSRGAAPRNLLDNSDFTNLVAQAGVGGSHGNQKYAADRWILTSGTVSYSAEKGLTLNGTITQKLERTPGAASAFVGTASGTAKISYANGAVTITSSGGVLKWAALYEGEYTDDTMPVYRSKGYGAELAECLRYFERFCADTSGYYVFAEMVLQRANSGLGHITYTPKRIGAPTITSNGNFRLRGAESLAVEGLSFGQQGKTGASITATTSGGTAGQCAALQASNDATAYIDISADL